MSVELSYQKVIASSKHQIDVIKRKIRKVVLFRILSFTVLTSLVTWSIVEKFSELLWFIPIPIVGFLLLIKWNNQLRRKSDVQNEIIDINQSELKALEGDYNDFSGGDQFQKENHDYAHDMDLFGNKSIFQYINRTTSEGSEKQLADYFNYFETDQEEIVKRQAAVKELTDELEWRQLFLAHGRVFKQTGSSVKGLAEWMKTGIEDFESEGVWRMLIWLAPFYAITVVTLSVLGFYSGVYALLFLTLPLSLVGRKLKTINHHHTKSSKYLDNLKKNKVLTTFIEEKSFESEKLNEIKSTLIQGGTNASTKIGELAKIVETLDNRSNPLFAFLANAFMLWDIKYTLQLKKWLKENKVEVDKWINAVYLMESYISFSNFSYNNPVFTYPTITDEYPINAIDLGHPLLKVNRIDNDYRLAGLKQFTIITGANMAGKSTFLRAVGVNLIIAMCGMPVCAKKFEFKPIRLFSSMRTADSLSDSESYFYAELKRLKSIVDELKGGERLFVILDEILKGTNSKDKAEGSKKFVAQLIKYDLAGIIATHDLSLCTLQELYPQNIQNKYFDVEIVNDELDFDYKLKDGICSNMNAEYLMQKMGITE